MEKKKAVEEKQVQKEEEEVRSSLMRNELQSLDNHYKAQLTMLREQAENHRQHAVSSQKASRGVLSQLKRELRAEMKERLEAARARGQEQRRKFQELIEDDGRL